MKLTLYLFFDEISRRITNYVLKGYLNQPLTLNSEEIVPSLFMASLSDVYAGKFSGGYKDSKELNFEIQYTPAIKKLITYFIRFLGERNNGKPNEIFESYTPNEFGELVCVFDYLCLDPKLIGLFWSGNSYSEMGMDDLIVILSMAELDTIKKLGENEQNGQSKSNIVTWIINDVWLSLCEYSEFNWMSRLETLVPEIKRAGIDLPPTSLSRYNHVKKGIYDKTIKLIYEELTQFQSIQEEFLTEPNVINFMCSLLKSGRFIYHPNPNRFPLDLLRLLQDNPKTSPEVICLYAESINWDNTSVRIKVEGSILILGHKKLHPMCNPKISNEELTEPIKRIIYNGSTNKIYYCDLSREKATNSDNGYILKVCGFNVDDSGDLTVIPIGPHHMINHDILLCGSRPIYSRKGNFLTCRFSTKEPINLSQITFVINDNINVPDLSDNMEQTEAIINRQNSMLNSLSSLSTRITSVEARNRNSH